MNFQGAPGTVGVLTPFKKGRMVFTPFKWHFVFGLCPGVILKFYLGGFGKTLGRMEDGREWERYLYLHYFLFLMDKDKDQPVRYFFLLSYLTQEQDRLRQMQNVEDNCLDVS